MLTICILSNEGRQRKRFNNPFAHMTVIGGAVTNQFNIVQGIQIVVMCDHVMSALL